MPGLKRLLAGLLSFSLIAGEAPAALWAAAAPGRPARLVPRAPLGARPLEAGIPGLRGATRAPYAAARFSGRRAASIPAAAPQRGRLAALAGEDGGEERRSDDARRDLDRVFEGSAEKAADVSIPVHFDPETKKLTLAGSGLEGDFLGRGEWKWVYVPPDRPHQVVKIFHAEGRPAFISRVFMRLESRNAEQLAKIEAGPRLLAFGQTDNGYPYQVTERVNGRLLKELIKAPGQLEPREAALVEELKGRLAANSLSVHDLDASNIMLGTTAASAAARAYIIDAVKIHTTLAAASAAGFIERRDWLRRLLRMPERDDAMTGLAVGMAEQAENIRAAGGGYGARASAWLVRQKEEFDRQPPLTPAGFAAVGLASFGIGIALLAGRPWIAPPAALAAAALFASARLRESYRIYIEEAFGKIVVGFQYRDGAYSPEDTMPAAAWRLTAKSIVAIPMFLAGLVPSGPGPYWLIGLSLVGMPAAAHILGLPPAAALRLGAAAAAAGTVGLTLLAYSTPWLGLVVLLGGSAVSGLSWAARRLLRPAGTPVAAQSWSLEDVFFWAGVALAVAGSLGPAGGGTVYKLGMAMGLGSGIFPIVWPKAKAFFARGARR